MRSYAEALLFAVQFLTRIPVRAASEPAPEAHRKALVLFPLCGWLIGLVLLGCWAVVPLTSPQSTLMLAALLICVETWLTGAFHLDGLADTADAFLSPPAPPDRKLEIMCDSRIGAMGTVALVLSLIVKTVLLAEVLTLGRIGALIVYPALGRWIQVFMFSASPYVRPDGIGKRFAQEADISTVLASTALMLPGLLLSGFWAGLICALAAVCLLLRAARKNIGGITGDTIGAGSVLAEIAFMLGVVLAA